MTIRKKYAVVIIGILTLFMCVYKCVEKSWPNTEPDYNVVELKFKNNKSLYLKYRISGMTYDKKIIALSTNQFKSIGNTKVDYLYPGADFIFYKISHDSLYLFVYSKSSKPDLFNSTIKIKQIELENREMMRLLKKTRFTDTLIFK
jgi:hypothetical protein